MRVAICVLFGVMQAFACLSVISGVLVDRVGLVPVSIFLTLFTACFTLIVALSIKWWMEIKVNEILDIY